MRVGIIRAGAVGSALALALVMRGAAREVVLVDRTRQRSRAVATDLQYSTGVAIGRYQGRRFQ
jgi:L-lactate dehydrogenase